MGPNHLSTGGFILIFPTFVPRIKPDTSDWDVAITTWMVQSSLKNLCCLLCHLEKGRKGEHGELIR